MMKVTEAVERNGRIGSRDPGLLAWLRLMRVHAAIDHRSTELVRQFELTLPQFDLIAQVGSHEGASQQELAEALMVTKGNITQLLDRLEERGLLERRQIPGRRGKFLFLTDAGWELNRRVVPAQEALITGLFAELSPDERQQLNGLLARMDRALTKNR